MRGLLRCCMVLAALALLTACSGGGGEPLAQLEETADAVSSQAPVREKESLPPDEEEGADRSALRDLFGREEPDAAEAQALHFDVLPQGDGFTKLSLDGLPDGITGAWQAAGGAGFVFRSQAAGYDGPVIWLVGIDADGNFAGIRMEEHNEVPGMGSRVGTEEYLERYRGLNDPDAVDVISGVTRTSQSLKNALRQAQEARELLLNGAAPQQPADGDAQGSRQLFSLSGTGSVTSSGSFVAREGETLTLTVSSNIAGGTVDLFLFDPDNNQAERISFAGEDQTLTIPLRAGTWAYNCTGFFDSGSFALVATAQ